MLPDAIVSGGNFHAEPVAFAADIVALAVAEIGAIAQRRVALMVDPTLSYDLPPFLTAAPGLNSGFMIAEVTTAALMSENKHLATPCSTDSTPTSANQEDHVSMAAHGARRLTPMVANLERILGIEALCAAQGVEFRAPLATSAPLQATLARLRAEVPAAGRGPLPGAGSRGRGAAGARGGAGRRLRRGLPGTRAVTPVEVVEGDGPVVLGLPHTGTWLPEDVAERLNPTGLALADTDWHIHELYAGLLPSATTVRATFHRYAIDANRGPDDASLYPGQNTTGLCPLTDFDGRPIYRAGAEPDAAAIAARVAAWHAPYHAALAAQIARVRARHGVAILYDCHSIRSVIPFLFDGTLPDFNVGTNNGASCAPEVEACVMHIVRGAPGHTWVLNGRFKGGWTTRHYGRPEAGCHAVQMELAQSTYMDEAPPWTWRAERADRLRVYLAEILETLESAAADLGGFHD